jgi:hypothetical protein
LAIVFLLLEQLFMRDANHASCQKRHAFGGWPDAGWTILLISDASGSIVAIFHGAGAKSIVIAAATQYGCFATLNGACTRCGAAAWVCRFPSAIATIEKVQDDVKIKK